MEQNFQTLGLSDALVAGLAKQDITVPTDIQTKMIPAIMTGKDVVGRSETGSGKTLAYLLPIFQRIDPNVRGTQAIILTPTHELAAQVHRQAELLAKNAGVNVGCALIIGTARLHRQVERLREKPPIVVGSTGRILDLIKRKKIQAHLVKTIVLDEGDRLLEDGNFAAVQAVIKTTLRDRQLVLLSASVGGETQQRAKEIMKEDALFVEGASQLGQVPDTISHNFILTAPREKFLNNPENIEVTVDKLNYHGIKAAGIYGQVGKLDRKTALDDFREGRVQVLVASDIGARGLDIPDVTHVINLDIPEDPTHYLHRAGRCGRQGQTGCAISIVTPYERRWIHKYEKEWGLRFAQKDMVYGKLTDSTKTKKDLEPRKSQPKEKAQPKGQAKSGKKFVTKKKK